KFMAGWRKARTGRNAHRDALLEFGIKYNRQSLDNQKSQFLETEQYMAIQCARIWHVPPYKIRSLEHGIKANVEQQSIDFVTDALLGWLVLEETSINRHVIRPLNEAGGLEDEYFAEFNAAGLLRGDLKSRYEAFGLARNWGWLSVNEIRRMENLPPIAGGNTYLQPLNMQPAGTQPPADPPPDTAPEPPPETLPDSGDD
ncbi:MAG: phage portal protein, partial [Pseudomonadota bacterium]